MTDIDYKKFLKQLVSMGHIKDPRLARAFERFDRAKFIKHTFAEQAYKDSDVLTESGQTTNKPSTVAAMLNELDIQPGQKVLEIGIGSGWVTAIISDLVGPQGEVYGVEIMPNLIEMANRNLTTNAVKNAKVFSAQKILGLPEHGPYDKILVSAYAKEVPQELLSQLKVGGTMVIPINNILTTINKTSETDYNKREITGHVFKPLIESN